MLLAGKTALVTGGSRGIGRAITLALAREGADVSFTYHKNTKAAEETAALIQAYGRHAFSSRINLADSQDIVRLFHEVAHSFGHLDIFVSNAVSATLRPVLKLSSRHWEYVLRANLTAFFECVQRAVPLMKGGTGKIVAITSLGSRGYAPGYAALGAAKAGIETLARYLAIELVDRGINVNLVCPGVVDTEALEAFSKVIPDLTRYKQELAARTPAGRIGTAEDVAGVVLFLCTPQADWIRGQTITADGGLSLAM
jgi:NAD(P)-dependent dehydrogenase (short-subunit alcohol dehydrogenase family)